MFLIDCYSVASTGLVFSSIRQYINTDNICIKISLTRIIKISSSISFFLNILSWIAFLTVHKIARCQKTRFFSSITRKRLADFRVIISQRVHDFLWDFIILIFRHALLKYQIPLRHLSFSKSCWNRYILSKLSWSSNYVTLFIYFWSVWR